MKTAVRIVIASVIVLSTSPLAWSKGETEMLVINGASLSARVEISDPDVVGTFNVWNGPGVRINGQPAYLDPDNLARSFIDWSRAEVTDRPEDSDSYEVTFIVGGRTPPRNKYVIMYEFDALTSGGYIYLPGGGDAHAEGNMSLILHGVEGNWFHSSESWERLVRPLIEVARSSD